ncbi:MAG TPA: tyrosine-type recombinase/integrase [Thermoanaerobaculia bacterium]
MRIDRACEEFLRDCANVRKLSVHTTRAYRIDLARFASFAGAAKDVASFDRAVLIQYVEHLFAEHHLKESSAKRHVASVRSLFRWLEETGHVTEDPFRGARVRIRLPRRLPRVLSRAELATILEHPASGDFGSITARVAAELLFATGVRVAELAALRDGDIDLAAGVITILGKGSRQRRVYIPDAEIRELILAYRRARDARERESDAFLVNSRGGAASPQYIRRLVRQLGEKAALTRRITPHMFRHSVATYLLEEGVDIRYVQRLLGHRSIVTTEIYTHVADAALKSRVIERHPRKSILRRT